MSDTIVHYFSPMSADANVTLFKNTQLSFLSNVYIMILGVFYFHKVTIIHSSYLIRLHRMHGLHMCSEDESERASPQ